MTLTILVAVLFLGVGLAMLLKPVAIAALLGIRNAEVAAYALRIAGMMVATFGLVLLVFSAVYRPAGVAQ